MANIGVVLAGGASKGAYELGVLRALEEYFGLDSIRCISASSIGAIIAQAYGMKKTDELTHIWKGLDANGYGKFFLSYSGNKSILSTIDSVLEDGSELPYEHYVSVWNFTRSKVEYIPFHTLQGEKLQKYMHGAIAIPFFSGGEMVDGNRILDGAFLDNIPAYPLMEKDLDYIFCVYFDNCNYIFENDTFDKKIIKLFDFPNKKMLEMMCYNSGAFDTMVSYGYDYTMRIVRELFESKAHKDEVYAAIDEMEKSRQCTYKPRLTADIVLNNINVVTKRYSKRISSRKKKK